MSIISVETESLNLYGTEMILTLQIIIITIRRRIIFIISRHKIHMITITSHSEMISIQIRIIVTVSRCRILFRHISDMIPRIHGQAVQSKYRSTGRLKITA